MKKFVAEFIGTFFLILTIGCTVIPAASGVIAPLAIGAVLMAMVFAGGHISGAHYNPAVTLGVFVRGRCGASDFVPYWLAQILAAFAASFVVVFLVGRTGAPMAITNVPIAFAAEFLFTFALVYVVLNCATLDAKEGNSFYGLAIGITVMAGAFAVGSISGGAFNPAVAIALALMKLISFSQIWIHIIAEFLAALVGALVFKFLNPGESIARAEGK